LDLQISYAPEQRRRGKPEREGLEGDEHSPARCSVLY